MSSATGSQTDARFETSAAYAEAETSNAKLAKQVELNAQKLHRAAEEAAAKAQTEHTSPAVAVNRLEEGLSEKTDAAAAEGHANVQGYVGQVKDLANSALATAQSYLPGHAAGAAPTHTTDSVQDTASSAFATTKKYLTQAQNAAAPIATSALATGIAAVESARTTATPYVQSAADTITRTIAGAAAGHGSAATTKPNEVDAKTAPLESGPHKVDTPYPATTTGQSTKVAGV